MSDAQHKEISAFLSFFSTFNLTRPPTSVSDLSDGSILVQVLSLVDAEYFRQPSRPSAQYSDNWVLRINALKRLYRLMTQYFADVLQCPTGSLDVPDLQAIAKDHDVNATLTMCRLTIAIGVQCERNKEIIGKIQALSDTDQHYLMKAIEQVMARITPTVTPNDIGGVSMTEDDHYYRIQSEKSQILSEKETLEKVYQALLDDHRSLQTKYDDVLSEKGDTLRRLREVRREVDSKRNDKSDTLMRGEIDRLRAELQKSEDNLAMVESELEKHTILVTDLTRKVDELQIQADSAGRLKDQLDEYRHAADKLQKTENVMEKYKKKLQESADMRQHVKALEKQNADLVDKNASLEEEYRKVSAFKPLMESYKNQIADLETKASSRTQEIDTLKFELDQHRTKLKIATEERVRDSETLELYQERVRELEFSSNRPVANSKAARRDEGVESSADEGNEANHFQGYGEEDSDKAGHDLGGELDDAISGTTMTDLKLQIRKLKRELDAVKRSEVDTSRLLVLENLLEDANRMKARYEADYLTAHREKLVLQRDLDEIRSGKLMGDGAEAAIALRQRLNETVDQLDDLRRSHTELEVKFDAQVKELTVAKSDLNLVNRDQLDILATLRESVNEDKKNLEVDMDRLKSQLKELGDKNRMQLEQVNMLLLEKVNLQSDGIGQREKMLQRERDFGDLRGSLSGKDVPEDVKKRLLAVHEENVNLKEQYKVAQEKLLKAKAFIKSQDKLFKEEQAAKASLTPQRIFEEAEASFRSQIKLLEEEVAREKHLMKELTQRYLKEQQLMLSAYHHLGMRVARDHLGNPQQGRSGPSSWLAQQRRNLGQTLRR